MKHIARQACLATLFSLATVSIAWGQRAPQEPHIGYAYPAGGRQGTTFEVTVGGQFLKDTSEVHVSGKGVRVSVVKYFRHLTQGEAVGLRMKLNDARDKLLEERKLNEKPGVKFPPLTQAMIAKEAGLTEAQLAALEDYRKRDTDPKRQPNIQLSEEVTIQVRIAADARPGDRELRLVTPLGMSNPMFFHVGQLPEYRENEPNDTTPERIEEALPVVLNGQAMPGDVDRFTFKAKKGTKLVAACGARELIPYLADAVPGWFQAVMALHDSKGTELAYADAFGFRQDPVLYYQIPEDGEYSIEVHDSIYRGREDFVYRITLGEVPYITSIFPLGGRAGSQPMVDVKGWNLPSDKLKVDAFYDRARPIRSVNVKQDRVVSNRMPFAVDGLPETVEQEPNDKTDQAQAVTLPMLVNGRIDRPGDIDYFRFDGKARDNVVIEVFARRLNSPVDSTLRLYDDEGQEVAANDDYEDKGAALTTHQADSRIAYTLPLTGTYYVRLNDAQSQGGPEYAYRLHIRPPRPDFELRVVPSSVIARAGTTVPLTVYALRRDGFAEDIALGLEGAPAGFKLGGAVVPGNQDKVRLTMTVPPTATDEPLALQLEGHSVLRNRKISHLAVPAEAMMQAFAYQHLVPAKDWTVSVVGKGSAKPPVRFTREDGVRIPLGGTATLRAIPANKQQAHELRFELLEQPDGISIASIGPEGDGVVVQLKAEGEKIKPGLRGNLLFSAILERSPPPTPDKPTPTKTRNQLGFMPAIPFEIMPK